MDSNPFKNLTKLKELNVNRMSVSREDIEIIKLNNVTYKMFEYFMAIGEILK